MFKERFVRSLVVPSLFAAAVCAGCSTSSPPANTAATSVSKSEPDPGIEVEIVQPTILEGAITATGKVLVTENKTASIGPVHEGRIVNLYAGQGSVVR